MIPPHRSHRGILMASLLPQDRMEKLQCDDTIQAWVKTYDMAKRIRCRVEYKPKLQGADVCRMSNFVSPPLLTLIDSFRNARRYSAPTLGQYCAIQGKRLWKGGLGHLYSTKSTKTLPQ